MKKGFTLIELLAVIVILAIIALIATPIVLSIIEDSKSNANLRSAENYLTAAKQSITNYQMNNPDQSVSGTYNVMKNGNLCKGITDNDKCNGKEIKVQVSGEKIMPGSITIGATGDLTKVRGLEINGKNYSYTNGSLKEYPIKVVYRWLTSTIETIKVGDKIDINDTTKYTTDLPTLDYPYYLKHVLDEENKVIETYACAKTKDKEYCLTNEEYGLTDNEEDYTGNMLILKELSGEGLNCTFDKINSICSDGIISFYVFPNGRVRTAGLGGRCEIDADGSSICIDL